MALVAHQIRRSKSRGLAVGEEMAAGEAPGFGCGIHDLTFSPNTPVARSAIVESVRTALVQYEPRIDVTITDEGPMAHAFVVISAVRTGDAGAP